MSFLKSLLAIGVVGALGFALYSYGRAPQTDVSEIQNGSPVKVDPLSPELPDFNIAEVSIQGDAIYPLYEDHVENLDPKNARVYGSQNTVSQWRDMSTQVNGDGSADQQGDYNFPICIVAGSAIRVPARGVKCRIKNTRVQLVSTMSVAAEVIDLRGKRIGHFDFGKVPVDFDAQHAAIWNSGVIGPTTLELAPHVIAKGVLKFTFTINAEDMAGANKSCLHQTERSVSSEHPFYALGEKPVLRAEPLILAHTIVDIACRNANGLSTEHPAEVVDAIFAEFKTRGMKRKAKDGFNRLDGAPLYYWKTPLRPAKGEIAAPNSMFNLLQNSETGGDGHCGAWAVLFRDSVKAVGIAGAKNATVEPTDGYAALFVRNLNFDGTDLPGLPAQGENCNPPLPTPKMKLFFEHALVEFENKLYDPSYGEGSFEKGPAGQETIHWQRKLLFGMKGIDGNIDLNSSPGQPSQWPARTHISEARE